MGGSIDGGYPKWFTMENPMKMDDMDDDWGVSHISGKHQIPIDYRLNSAGSRFGEGTCTGYDLVGLVNVPTHSGMFNVSELALDFGSNRRFSIFPHPEVVLFDMSSVLELVDAQIDFRSFMNLHDLFPQFGACFAQRQAIDASATEENAF